MKLKLPSIKIKSVSSLRKIECPYCGARHIPSRDGVCPRCGKRYLLTASENEKRESFGRKLSERLGAFWGELTYLATHTDSRRRKAIAAMFGCVIVAAVLFISAVATLSGLEAPVFRADERTYIPVIYRSGSRDYVLFHDGKTVELGMGSVLKYDCSSDGGIVYALYSGRITADTESAREGDYVVRIAGSKKVEIIAKGEKGRVSYVTGGDGEHLYCVVPNTSAAENALSAVEEVVGAPAGDDTAASGDGGTESTVSVSEASQSGEGGYVLWYAKSKRERVMLSDRVTSCDLAVSPNGRYLLYSEVDPEGSQLMKYRISKKSAQGTGAKNAVPAAIDNKGKFFAYFKTDGEGKVHFNTVDGGIAEYTVLPSNAELCEVVMSADMHTAALRFRDRVIFKAQGWGFCEVTFDTSSDFGFLRDEYLNPVYSPSLPSVRFSVLKGGMFPYFYYDSDGNTLYRVLEDGSKAPYFDVAVDAAVVNNEGDIAFTSGASLYVAKLSGKASKRLASEKFGNDYSLIDISPDGKTLYAKEKNGGRVYTLPTAGTDSAAAQYLTEDAVFIRSSDDSKALFYTKANEAYLKRSSGTPRLTDSGIIPEYTCVFTRDFSQFVYAKDMGEDSLGNPRRSLYIYRDGKPMFVTDNLDFITVPHGESFTDTRSSHIMPVQTGADDASGSLLIGKSGA